MILIGGKPHEWDGMAQLVSSPLKNWKSEGRLLLHQMLIMYTKLEYVERG